MTLLALVCPGAITTMAEVVATAGMTHRLRIRARAVAVVAVGGEGRIMAREAVQEVVIGRATS